MRNLYAACLSVFCVASIGCESHTPAPSNEKVPPKEDAANHGHGSTGPHGGTLIELGDEEYHAEFVQDEKTCDVTICILDGAAKNAVAIEATELTINLKQDGKPAQYKLAAAPQAGETDGKSSRFVSKENHDLCEAIEAKDSDARLSVSIAGKSYSGKIEHTHEEGHRHKDEVEKK